MAFFNRKNGKNPNQRLSDDDLLNRIRNGDQQAEQIVWLTYYEAATDHARIELNKRGNPESLGSAEEYAKDAFLELLKQARLIGANVLKHEHTTIKGWLKQAATNMLMADHRKDQRHDRDGQLYTDEADDTPPSMINSIEDGGADAFSHMSEKDRDQLVRDVLSGESEELQQLLRFKFMDGFSWSETARLLRQLFPNNKPPFTESYAQKTYWDRLKKDEFKLKMINTFKRYGHDLRRKR